MATSQDCHHVAPTFEELIRTIGAVGLAVGGGQLRSTGIYLWGRATRHRR